MMQVTHTDLVNMIGELSIENRQLRAIIVILKEKIATLDKPKEGQTPEGDSSGDKRQQ